MVVRLTIASCDPLRTNIDKSIIRVADSSTSNLLIILSIKPNSVTVI